MCATNNWTSSLQKEGKILKNLPKAIDRFFLICWAKRLLVNLQNFEFESLAIVTLSLMPFMPSLHLIVVLKESQGLKSSFWGTFVENPSNENRIFVHLNNKSLHYRLEKNLSSYFIERIFFNNITVESWLIFTQLINTCKISV